LVIAPEAGLRHSASLANLKMVPYFTVTHMGTGFLGFGREPSNGFCR
jgi:hypothetical protein